MSTVPFYKFPKIRGVKDVATDIVSLGGNFTVQYTEKLHGTNTAIVLQVREKKLQSFYTQSRNRILSIEDDNYGFCKHMSENFNLPEVLDCYPADCDVIIYGEWVGKGIHEGVGLSNLDRRYFMIFAVYSSFPNIDMPHYRVHEIVENLIIQSIIKENPDIFTVLNKFEGRVIVKDNDLVSMLDQLTEIAEAYAKDSPIANFLGSEGLGEGIVCHIVNSNIDFKIKGSAYSERKVGKAIRLSKNENVSIELVSHVTKERLDQGIEYLKEMNIPLELKAIPKLLEYSIKDIEDEYGTRFSPKEGKYVGNMVVSNFKEYLNYLNTLL